MEVFSWYFIANTRSMFALLYQSWSYILSSKKHGHLLAAAILINRKFENYRETSHNPDAVVGFYDAKQLFYDHSMEKMYVL